MFARNAEWCIRHKTKAIPSITKTLRGYQGTRCFLTTQDIHVGPHELELATLVLLLKIHATLVLLVENPRDVGILVENPRDVGIVSGKSSRRWYW